MIHLYFINGIRDRNRALDGDEVVVELYPEDKWKISSNYLNSYDMVLRVTRKKCGKMSLKNNVSSAQ